MKSVRDIVRLAAISLRHIYFTRIYGMDISSTARVSFGARIDRTNPKGVHIDDDSYITSGALVLSHDFSRGVRTDTRIGKRCFIGANVIIMAGVTIGDEVIVGAGAIVTKDIPPNSIVVGNPAKVIRSGIHTGRYGRLVPPGEN